MITLCQHRSCSLWHGIAQKSTCEEPKGYITLCRKCEWRFSRKHAVDLRCRHSHDSAVVPTARKQDRLFETLYAS